MTVLSPTTLKLLLLLASGIAHQIAMSPPNPPAKKIVKQNFFEMHVHTIVRIAIFPFWIAVILDMIATVLVAIEAPASAFPLLASTFLAPWQSSGTLLRPGVAFFLGAITLITSAYLRFLCYKTLGDQFRFEVSIQAKHKLVTSGPYSFVRHPSYLALYGDYIGSVTVLLARSSYLREYVLEAFLNAIKTCATSPGSTRCEQALSSIGSFQVASMLLVVVWIGSIVFIERQLAGRLSWEDEVLHKEFGKEWERYAEHVRWRIIPGIL